ncbi:MAG: glycoside hydrolase family 32 protein, partial [Aeromonas sp.]
SKDLLHWQELPIALNPDTTGGIWSGSAITVAGGVSGFGTAEKPAHVLAYTDNDHGTFTQRLAVSTDGRHYEKFSGNPVLKQVALGDRDPKVFWHEPTQGWIMLIYTRTGKKGEAHSEHVVKFYGSKDLKSWEHLSDFTGGSGDDNYLFECPDFFQLKLDGKEGQPLWVLMGANSQYAIGDFDGKRFVAKHQRLQGQLAGRDHYAAQTVMGDPLGRVVQIGWLRYQTQKKASFNQCMSLPTELKLVSTAEGPRLTYTPVREMEKLRGVVKQKGPQTLRPGAANPLADVQDELLEIRTRFHLKAATDQLTLTVRGVPLVFSGAGMVSIAGHSAPLPIG